MAELTPVSKIQYNQFKDLYNPDLPYNQQNLMLQSKIDENTFNQYSNIANQEKNLGFFDKLGSGLANLFAAQGAEKPQVPNLSLGYNMPTFDLGTGITNTAAASPFKIGIEDILNQYNVPNLQSRNLVQQLIEESTAPVTSSVMYDEFPEGFSFTPQGTTLNTSRFADVDLEPGYLDRAGSYGQDVYAEQEKQKSGGIGGLLKFLVGLAVPGAGFLMNLPGRGLEGIRNLNQRLRATDFGQSKTLQEYMSRRKERDAIARAQEAAPSVYESARDQGFTGPRGGFSTTGRYNESAFSSTKSSRGRQDF